VEHRRQRVAPPRDPLKSPRSLASLGATASGLRDLWGLLLTLLVVVVSCRAQGRRLAEHVSGSARRVRTQGSFPPSASVTPNSSNAITRLSLPALKALEVPLDAYRPEFCASESTADTASDTATRKTIARLGLTRNPLMSVSDWMLWPRQVTRSEEHLCEGQSASRSESPLTCRQGGATLHADQEGDKSAVLPVSARERATGEVAQLGRDWRHRGPRELKRRGGCHAA
jgi:hypothetical protein